MKKPEILSPAGNYEKFEFAVRYGADAVYLAGDSFGMRAAADNFSFDEMKAAVAKAHQAGVKVYVTVNTMPRNNDIDKLPEYLEKLGEIKPDALIVADLGVFCQVKKCLPDIDVHISTQGANFNYQSCRAWHDMGAKRVVLARELTLEEIAEIRAKTPNTLELEAFVHGSMCVSVSGRCLLSDYYTGRGANEGKCAQPCRWIYRFAEEKRPENILTGEIHPEGTYIFGSRDMCLVEHIPELYKAGINSFKIEGRMKSAYYTAVVTNAYRMAMDDWAEGREFNPAILRELDSVSHREYCTGYYFNNSMQEPNLASTAGYLKEKSFFATITDYDAETGLAKCCQKNKMLYGEAARFLTPGKTACDITIGRLYDSKMNPIESTPHPQMEFYMELPFAARAGDIITSAQ
ncbi:MAG: U32 family peptidase [Ruminococcaceae bacterium]|nr:U32 family peptidase [Oscillospiraceae bacterium]